MWLFRIIGEVFSFFSGLFKSRPTPSSPDTRSPPPIPRERKKFQVLGESEIQFRSPLQIRNNNNVSEEENRFKMHGTTMPKTCPFCGTENRTTRSQNNNHEWHCKECQYEW